MARRQVVDRQNAPPEHARQPGPYIVFERRPGVRGTPIEAHEQIFQDADRDDTDTASSETPGVFACPVMGSMVYWHPRGVGVMVTTLNNFVTT